MRLVVTGTGGGLGRAFLAQVPAHHDVHAFDRSALDIGDHDAVRQTLDPLRADAIVNLAAFTKVDVNESEPARAFRDNAMGPQHLALSARATGAVTRARPRSSARGTPPTSCTTSSTAR